VQKGREKKRNRKGEERTKGREKRKKKVLFK